MTTCKEAIKDIEVDGKVAAEMEEVRLCPIAMMKPLITKMDASLSGLKKCKQLRLSSNAIQKIEGEVGCGMWDLGCECWVGQETAAHKMSGDRRTPAILTTRRAKAAPLSTSQCRKVPASSELACSAHSLIILR